MTMGKIIKGKGGNIKVTQSYIMTVLPYRTSIYGKRILYRLVEFTHPVTDGIKLKENLRQLYMSPDLYGNVQFTMYLSDILCGDTDNHYQRIKKAFDELQSVKVWDENEEEYKSTPFVYNLKIKLRTGVATFCVADWVWNTILNLTKGYRKYELLTAMKLKSSYSMRFYEIMSGQKKPMYFSLEKLRELFCFEEQQYSQPASIRERIIKPSKKELDKNAPYSFDFKEERISDKKTSPIIGFTFYPIFIEENQDVELQRKERAAKLTTRNLFGDSEIRYLLNSYGFESDEIAKNKQNIDKAIKVLGKSDFIDFIKEIWENACPNAENPKGYLIGAIKQKTKDVESAE
jgi:plasmid replication initiation protein